MVETFTFKCPHCSSRKLLALYIGATAKASITIKDGEVICGEADITDSCDTIYQCSGCGNEIASGTEDDLLEALGLQ